MKSKEQIYEEIWASDESLTKHETAIRAMDEYAKQQAISFSMWALEKGWYDDNCGVAGMWNLHEDNYDPDQQFRFTPAEFYAQFIEQQTTNK